MPSDPTSPASEQRPPVPANFEIIRDFSRILSHSLDLPSLVRHFILRVRESFGVNRIALFLQSPRFSSSHPPRPPESRLHCVCSIGIPADVQTCVELSATSGIGHWIIQSGQILRADQTGALLSPTLHSRVQNEFNLLGCQFAIPINDRERTIGVAMLGGHLTRAAFTDEELQLMFHLLEELGMSVRNNWLHSELAANHKLFGDVLASMTNGSLVAGPDLEVLHVNPAMLRFIGAPQPEPGKPPLTFGDLPAPLAERIHEVVEKGEEVPPFSYRPTGPEPRTFRVTVIPFQNKTRRLPQSAMVLMEDVSEIEHARQLAAEAENTKLTSLVAKRFAHEIRNSLVPLNSHLQLIDDRYHESSFQDSLKQALASETARIARFTEQILFLAETRPPPSVLTGIEKLLREAFAKAQTASRLTGILTVQNRSNISSLRCNPAALTQAFQEIFINGLQSHSKPPTLTVQLDLVIRDDRSFLRIGFLDEGPGFTEETSRTACEPFFTSRTSGIGLGLTVASRAANEHNGWLQISPRSKGDHPDVAMYFPAQETHEQHRL